MPTPIVPSPSLDGVSSQIQDHTEQAAIELVYIKQANQIIGNAMANLTSAVDATQSSLNLLSLLQQFHNQLSVSTPPNFPFNYVTGVPTAAYIQLAGFNTEASAVTKGLGFTGKTTFAQLTALTTEQYRDIYQKVASAYYGTQINPAVNPLFNGATNLASLLNIRTNLLNEMMRLSSMTSALQQGNGSLLFALKTVYNELPTDLTTYNKWVLDGYVGNSASRGNIQNDLTTAITAAQSLNDTQKENVRQFLFVFQEYYQSAAAILSSISQIIKQMASKISQ